MKKIVLGLIITMLCAVLSVGVYATTTTKYIDLGGMYNVTKFRLNGTATGGYIYLYSGTQNNYRCGLNNLPIEIYGFGTISANVIKIESESGVNITSVLLYSGTQPNFVLMKTINNPMLFDSNPYDPVEIPLSPVINGSAGDGQVTLNWSVISAATTYKVYKDNAYFRTVSGTSDTVTGLTNGTSYNFAVTAVNAAGESSKSNTLTLTPYVALPGVPVITGSAGDAKVDLTWSAVSGAISYKVYCGGTYLKTVTSAGDTVTGLTNGTSYTFAVTAVNVGGESAKSNTLSLTPQVALPGVPVITGSAGDAKVDLSWSVVFGATSYKIYRDNVYLKTVSGTSDTVTGLTNGTSYNFAVTAVNAGGESAKSNLLVLMPLVVPHLPGKSTLTATAGNRVINLSWSPVPNATGYRIYQDGVMVSDVTDINMTVKSLVNGTTYSFAVSAYNDVGEGDLSNVCKVAPVAAPEMTWENNGKSFQLDYGVVTNWYTAFIGLIRQNALLIIACGLLLVALIVGAFWLLHMAKKSVRKGGR